MEPNLGLSFLLALLRHQIKKRFGDEGLDLLGEILDDTVSDEVKTKYKFLLDKKLSAAAQRVDECFRHEVSNQDLAEWIISLPLKNLPSLNSAIVQLPSQIDESQLVEALRENIQRDWGSLNEQEINLAIDTYLKCIRKSLLPINEFALPIIGQAVLRTENKVDALYQLQLEIESRQTAREEGLNQALSQGLEGLIERYGQEPIATKTQKPVPDTPPHPPQLFLERNNLIDTYAANLENTSWLALVDSPGKGKTQIAHILFDRYEPKPIYWISLRDVPSEQLINHLEQQLLIWLQEVSKGKGIKNADEGISLHEICDAIVGICRDGGLLVIDDVPDLVLENNVANSIELLLNSFRNTSIRTITTSQRKPIPRLVNSFHDKVLIENVPGFTIEELDELLKLAQAPAQVIESLHYLILATSKGHPSLIQAIISWLKSQNWKVGEQEFDALLSGEMLNDTFEYYRRTTLRLLPDDASDFLYRLSLANSSFNRSTAIKIADVEEKVENPGILLDELTGPWIEKTSNNEYLVTPLLGSAGRNYLDNNLQKRVHKEFANQMLSEKTIYVSSAHNLLAHLWSAKDFETFFYALSQLLLFANTPRKAKSIDWATAFFSAEIGWPDEFTTEQRILTRALQIRVRSYSGKDYSALNDDLEKILAEENEYEPFAKFFAFTMAGPTLENLQPEIGLYRAFEVIKIQEEHKLLPENILAFSLEELVWLPASQLKNKDSIIHFIDQIIKMPIDMQNKIFALEQATSIFPMVIDRIWAVESKKSGEARNWNNVLNTIAELRDKLVNIENSVVPLAFARAEAIVRGEFLEKTDDAIDILNNIDKPRNPDLQFLLEYSLGSIYFVSKNSEHVDKAIKHYEIAQNINGQEYDYYRFDTIKRLAILFGKKELWLEARQYCVKSIHLASKEDYLAYERLDLMGELAWINWASGNKKRCYGSLFGYLSGVLALANEPDFRWKESFNKLGHGLGWFVSMEGSGSPPKHTLSGEMYSPVQSGLFSLPREQLGTHESSYGYTTDLLCLQLAVLGFDLGLLRGAYKLLDSAVQPNDNPAIEYLTESQTIQLAALTALFGNPQEAISFGIRATRFYHFYKNHPKVKTLDRAIVKTQWEKSSPMEKQDFEKHLWPWVFIPLFVYLLSEKYSFEQSTEIFGNWKEAVIASNNKLEAPGYWEKVIGLLEDLYSHYISGKSIDTTLFDRDDPHLSRVLYLVDSTHKERKLQDAIQEQVIAIDYLIQISSSKPTAFWGVGKFLRNYWLEIAQNQRFALKNPDLFSRQIYEITKFEGLRTAVKVIRAACSATKVKLPDEVSKRFNGVETNN